MTEHTTIENRIDTRQVTAGFRWLVALVVLGTLAVAGRIAGFDMALTLLTPAAVCMFFSSRAWGFAAGYREGTAVTAVTLANKITEREEQVAQVPPADPSVPGLVALRDANARIEGWAWCEEHRSSRYSGNNPCDRLHQMSPSAAGRVCGYHLRVHGPGEFGLLCLAWDDVRRDELERRARRRVLRWRWLLRRRWLHP